MLVAIQKVKLDLEKIQFLVKTLIATLIFFLQMVIDSIKYFSKQNNFREIPLAHL